MERVQVSVERPHGREVLLLWRLPNGQRGVSQWGGGLSTCVLAVNCAAQGQVPRRPGSDTYPDHCV